MSVKGQLTKGLAAYREDNLASVLANVVDNVISELPDDEPLAMVSPKKDDLQKLSETKPKKPAKKK